MTNYNLSERMKFDIQRTALFGAIGGAYSKVGTPLLFPAIQFMISNLTNANLQFSFDGVNDAFPLGAGIQWINDNRANRTELSTGFYLSIGEQLWVKTIGGAPSSGAVYFSVIYGGGQ